MLVLLPVARAAEPPSFSSLLSLTPASRVEPADAVVTARGGIDSSEGPFGVVEVEGILRERVALRATVRSSVGEPDPAVGVALRGDIVRQEHAGVDLAAGARWKAAAFSGEPGELEAFLVAGHRWDRFGLTVGATAGQSLGGRDADVEAALGATAALGERVSVGIDGRARFGISDEENDEEAAADFIAGPTVGWWVGPLGFAVYGGIGEVMRGAPQSQARGLLTVGSAF